MFGSSCVLCVNERNAGATSAGSAKDELGGGFPRQTLIPMRFMSRIAFRDVANP